MSKVCHVTLIIAISLTLIGCSTPIPQIKTIYVDKPIFIQPDKELIKPCKMPDPSFIPDNYSNLSFNDKENTLVDYINSILVLISECNSQLTILNEWYIKTEKIYGEPKSKPVK